MKTRWCVIIVAMIASINLAQGYNPEKIKIGKIYYELDLDYKTAAVINSLTGNTNPRASQSYSGSIKIPSAIMYEGEIYEVTKIDFRAFQYCDNLYSITIPNSVKEIGAYAFNGCHELTTIRMPEKIRRIEEYTFENCFKLESIHLNNNLQYIGRCAFDDCWALKVLEIPSSVKKIEYDAFYNVNNVIYNGHAEGSPWGEKNINKSSDGYLTFTDKSKTVVASCAKHASGSITIPDGVTKISANAFENCKEITSISIPSTLKYIEYGAFIGCSQLRHLTIPKSVQTIEVETFRGCKALTLKIPEKFRGELETIDCERVIYY